MGPRLNNTTFRHDMNLIRQAGSGETVRNHDHGAPASEMAETSKPISFRPRIHRAGRFVEDQYGSPAQKSPRQGDTLPFPYAQLSAICEPASEHLIVAGGKPVDDLVGARISSSFRHEHRAAAIVEVSQSDVLARRGIVMNRLLKQDRDGAANIVKSEVSQVHTIQFNRAAVGVVEAAQQLQKRALTRAVGSDNCGDRTRGDGQIEVIESEALFSGVAERDALEPDLHANAARDWKPEKEDQRLPAAARETQTILREKGCSHKFGQHY